MVRIECGNQKWRQGVLIKLGSAVLLCWQACSARFPLSILLLLAHCLPRLSPSFTACPFYLSLSSFPFALFISCCSLDFAQGAITDLSNGWHCLLVVVVASSSVVVVAVAALVVRHDLRPIVVHKLSKWTRIEHEMGKWRSEAKRAKPGPTLLPLCCALLLLLLLT